MMTSESGVILWTISYSINKVVCGRTVRWLSLLLPPPLIHQDFLLPLWLELQNQGFLPLPPLHWLNGKQKRVWPTRPDSREGGVKESFSILTWIPASLLCNQHPLLLHVSWCFFCLSPSWFSTPHCAIKKKSNLLFRDKQNKRLFSTSSTYMHDTSTKIRFILCTQVFCPSVCQTPASAICNVPFLSLGGASWKIQGFAFFFYTFDMSWIFQNIHTYVIVISHYSAHLSLILCDSPQCHNNGILPQRSILFSLQASHRSLT